MHTVSNFRYYVQFKSNYMVDRYLIINIAEMKGLIERNLDVQSQTGMASGSAI